MLFLTLTFNSLGFGTFPMLSSPPPPLSEPPLLSPPMPPIPPPEVNPCEGKKPVDAMFTNAYGELDPSRTIPNYFDDKDCAEMMDWGFQIDLPQAGMDVTDDGLHGDLDYKGTFDPITTSYSEQGLCPVNVHWHLGTEHRSAGQYDEDGVGPRVFFDEHIERRKLAYGQVRQGLMCHHYDETDPIFTTEYTWEYCDKMHVGMTYEVHWPHSAAGACGTKWQYQFPFYDGVFCKDGVISLGDEPAFNVPQKVGVEGQIFTIVNSDAPEYQNDKLFEGAWKDSTHWTDVAKYVGSTTGTKRDNEVCSFYSPITWQVDRTCHMVSAKSFDLMCKVMLEQADDFHGDIHPHGSRVLVDDTWTSAHLFDRKQ
eukprot:CAMPEP_0119305302 /NCGR_PEP_ID=MMETSP1333-20130426/6329_1 /TAXON_ID=418940 /ORGANISM="Scyphosphaera apsteinii, Strain RCC1455" /LENGTH=366 /DNA_ID=CAMNT_0007308365 /DNA_START=30 /DNA_END=1130 /DNA_ORIENTATION=-